MPQFLKMISNKK